MASSVIGAALGAARKAGVDRAAAFALTSRVWQLVAAPVTLLVIASRFSADVQGYYYAFISLLALQSFAELGLSIVIVNITSHEWSRLSVSERGTLAGDPDALSRLVGFGRLVFTWYAAAGLIFMAVVWPVGYWFFGRAEDAGVAWQGPWGVLVVLTGLQLSLLAFTAVLEGCNQVATVQKYRVIQTIASTSAFWLAAGAGAGLWAAAAIAAVRLAVDSWLIIGRYRRFFGCFAHAMPGQRLSWRHEVWPMQWRLGVSGVVNYFAFSLFTPVMFAYHGAATAGRMGMTMQMVGGVQALALVFLTTRVPQFGVLVARRDYAQLEPLWRRTSLVSLAVMGAGGCAVVLLVAALWALDLAIADRLLDPVATLLLVASVFLLQVSQCQTAYLRAHRRELIAVMSVTTSLGIAALVWLLGRRWGPQGALAGYLVMAVVVVVWESTILREFQDRRRAEVAA